ncbi:MAG: hypothetical protein GX444_09430 [Myxococcales bacterium]|nr:hypothetical protein [Myxococcales bacterium]
MEKDIFRYQFKDGLDLQEIEESLLLAAIAAEGIHGRSALRLAGAFLFDADKSSCVIDGSNEIGRHIAAIFTGFLTKQFGDEAFTVEKVDKHNPQLSPTL